MKKTILLSLFALAFSSLSAQSFQIREAGSTINVSGDTIYYDIMASEVTPGDEFAFWEHAKFHVYNFSGSDQQIRLKRVRLNVPADWDDKICWPPTCFNTSGNPYLTPNSGAYTAPIIYDGGNITDKNNAVAEIKPQFYPGTLGSIATYKYVLMDASATQSIDSITFIITYTDDLGINDLKKDIVVSLNPNPASNYVNVSAAGLSNAQIVVLDVLGNVVYKNEFSNELKLNTTSLNDGVYFINIQSDGAKRITKKLVVRH